MFLGLAATDYVPLLQNEADMTKASKYWLSVKGENDTREFNYESPLSITSEARNIECYQLSLTENDVADNYLCVSKFMCTVCNTVFDTAAEHHQHVHSPVLEPTGKFTTLDEACDCFQTDKHF